MLGWKILVIMVPVKKGQFAIASWKRRRGCGGEFIEEKSPALRSHREKALLLHNISITPRRIIALQEELEEIHRHRHLLLD